jgi:hypothetical protein
VEPEGRMDALNRLRHELQDEKVVYCSHDPTITTSAIVLPFIASDIYLSLPTVRLETKQELHIAV